MPIPFAQVLCEDAGSSFCPCHLALTGNCLCCPVINQTGSCDRCAWSGTCVWVESHWARGQARPGRPEHLAQVVDRWPLTKTAFALELAVPSHLVNALQPAGSFLMVRPAGQKTWFDLPLAVARLDPAKSTVTHYIQLAGPKTRALSSSGEALWVRGPFANGLVGRGHINAQPPGRALLVAVGIGQGPALHAATQMLAAKRPVDALLGPGDLGRVFINDELAALGASVTQLDSDHARNGRTFQHFLAANTYRLLVSAGSDEQHRVLGQLLRQASPKTPLVYTNNAVMCCGEGICGSCTRLVGSGLTRACKAQITSPGMPGN